MSVFVNNILYIRTAQCVKSGPISLKFRFSHCDRVTAIAIKVSIFCEPGHQIFRSLRSQRERDRERERVFFLRVFQRRLHMT